MDKARLRWPTPIEYQDAVSHPARCFTDPELRVSRVEERTRYGAPLPVAGQYAHVYRLRPPDGQSRAVRLFLRDATDRAARYAAIRRHLDGVSLRALVPFDFQERGIQIGIESYPLVRMEWAEGEPLHAAVERRINTPGAIAALAERFHALIFALEQARIAHGDLQHDNLLVDSATGAIRLIDYDGMFVPQLAARGSAEIGHPAYQHPRRDRTHYGPGLDRFSVLVIHASLTILRYTPDLWYRLHNGDNLLFRRTDFIEPGESYGFRTIRANVWRYPSAVRAVEALEEACHTDPLQASALDQVL